MKKVVMFLLMVLPVIGQAKVSDFNALINENVKEQRKLHEEVKSGVSAVRVALEDESSAPMVVQASRETAVNVPTNKKFLRFKKEIVNHRAAEKDAEKRLANEFKTMDQEF